MTDTVIHHCPLDGEATTPCCGCSPLELLRDRITADPASVTCTGEDRARPFVVYIAPPYKCNGDHLSRNVKHVGEHDELMIEICADAQCARIFAHCGHPREQNAWDESGTVLICAFCGRDCT